MIFDAIFYALSGFFMKISDQLSDEVDQKIFAIVTGLLCVFFTLLVSLTNGDAACIFISILIGTAIAHKVDSINHIISAIIFVLILIIAGVPHFSWFCLIICTIAAYIDELGNDKFDIKKEEIKNKSSFESIGLLDKFFEYRYTLKITVLIFSLLGLANIIIPNSLLSGNNFFEPITFIYFYLYDLSYEFADLIFDRIYKFF